VGLHCYTRDPTGDGLDRCAYDALTLRCRSGNQQRTENSESYFSHRDHINPTSDKKSTTTSSHASPDIFPPIPDVLALTLAAGHLKSIAWRGRLAEQLAACFSECWPTSVLKKLHKICSKRLQGQKLSQGKLLQI
jgi:hypothetical protein